MPIIENTLTRPKANRKHLAFLVSDDCQVTKMVTRMHEEGIRTNVYYTMQDLEPFLDKNARKPDAFVVDMDHFDLSTLPYFQNGTTAQPPEIFALSSKTDIDTRLKSVQCNVHYFTPKPFDTNEFMQHVISFFEGSDDVTHDILIVDDDPITVRFCQKFLESENTHVRFIENPKDILKELKKKKPDLILLDYLMPYASGLDINRIIRQIYSTSEIPVLFMTGSTKEEILTKMRKDSGFDPIIKPIRRDEFVDRVFGVMQ